MSAPLGNQFWKLRSKHGRDRIITDPQALSDAADEYFQYCIDNPIFQMDIRGKDADTVWIEHPRVFQKDELAVFCGVSQWRVISDLKNLSEDFLQVIMRIESIIASQKFAHASVGMFNANIIARDLGLRDNSDITSGGDPLQKKATIKLSNGTEIEI